MRFEVHTKDGLIGVRTSRKQALLLAPRFGKFAILEKHTKHAYPHGGMSGNDGVCYRHVMLLYPPGAVCRMVSPEQFIRESLAPTT